MRRPSALCDNLLLLRYRTRQDKNIHNQANEHHTHKNLKRKHIFSSDGSSGPRAASNITEREAECQVTQRKEKLRQHVSKYIRMIKSFNNDGRIIIKPSMTWSIGVGLITPPPRRILLDFLPI